MRIHESVTKIYRFMVKVHLSVIGRVARCCFSADQSIYVLAFVSYSEIECSEMF